MNVEERNRDHKALNGFKGAMDLGMGLIYIGVSAYVATNPSLTEPYGVSVYIFSVLFGAYGIFRLYRGLVTFKNAVKKRN